MARDLQLSASYLAREDRVLLRGAFPDGTEIRLLFTRRLTRLLLRELDELATKMVKVDIAVAAEAKRQVAEFSREVAIEQADFTRKYVRGKPHPVMAEGPRLVTHASFAPKADDRIGIRFTLDKGERLRFALPTNALWTLGHLLARQAERGEWNLHDARKASKPAAASAVRRLN